MLLLVKLLKPATLLKVTFLHGCFSRFLNCTNSTKSRKTSQLILHYSDTMPPILQVLPTGILFPFFYRDFHNTYQD